LALFEESLKWEYLRVGKGSLLPLGLIATQPGGSKLPFLTLETINLDLSI